MAIPQDIASEDIDQIESDDLIETYSWTRISSKIAIKTLDRSSFYHYGTGIPPKLRSFFQVDELLKGGRIETVLVYNDSKYKAHFVRKNDLIPNARTQLRWLSDFSSVLKNELPKWYDIFGDAKVLVGNAPELRFTKTDNENEYLVMILDAESIANDIDSEAIENQDIHSLTEGKNKDYYGKRYERSAENRKRAIEIHGYGCAVCGFDFSKVYGERGKGFIEVHHIRPLSTIRGEIEVNPETDLVTVCANCHRMIHRDSDNILSIDELKQKIFTSKRNG